jgi:purine-binding chemotaxis protein CheW
MFASEKVMLEYLGQLLTEQESEVVNVNQLKNETAAPEEVPVLSKKASNIEKPAVNKEIHSSIGTGPKLQPISSKVNKLKEYKEEVVSLAEPNSVEKLLQQVELKQQEELQLKQATDAITKKETKLETKVSQQEVEKPAPVEEPEAIPEEAFQALFFEVAGLVLAVPLQELGGIHNLGEINSLFGKPDWFKGVMINREKKLNVVDSARWVMPERFNQTMEDSLDYQYLITLGQSEWGLAAEKLVETETINPEDVKWRSKPGKRPWLFGTIKEKMCALLHVSDLVAMLEQGVNARQE